MNKLHRMKSTALNLNGTPVTENSSQLSLFTVLQAVIWFQWSSCNKYRHIACVQGSLFLFLLGTPMTISVFFTLFQFIKNLNQLSVIWLQHQSKVGNKCIYFWEHIIQNELKQRFSFENTVVLHCLQHAFSEDVIVLV